MNKSEETGSFINKSQGAVDLSKPISPQMSVWPGDSHPEFREISNLEKGEVNLSEFAMSLHSGTHIDAPRHFIQDGETIDELSMENFYGEAVIYSSTEEPDGREISLEEVQESGVEVKRGDIFILDTGARRITDDSEYYKKFPTPSRELLEWLLERGVKCYGTDSPSVDPLGTRTHENHKLVLGNGVPIVENLTGLNRVGGVARFTFLALPLKLKSLEASPCRAVAFLD